jgi:polyphosphate kinase 2 (PPK2 family)
LQRALSDSDRSVVIAYEGWDAGGKGGTIRRITESLDPRGYIVHPIAAPQGDERVKHYLWRFWTRLPRRGQIAIFDRTWYGRVLVERVEKFAAENEWRRAYREINQFEKTLSDNGVMLIKIWLHISKDEQLKRFKARQQDDYKKWKITDEDWRNRRKWTRYLAAAEEMFAETSSVEAPWHLIEANRKWYARVKVLSVVVDTMEKGLKVSA